MRRFIVSLLACACSGVATVAASAQSPPVTPITHLVVIFQENNSFDHYFATYPNAANPPGEPKFNALPNTPTANGLNAALLDGGNINSTLPFRLDRSAANLNCDNSNAYNNEQAAYDKGLLDQFPQKTSAAAVAASGGLAACPTGIGMAYYDGNTVTALWNYAQHFAMSDNFYDTEFGATILGHLNLISGQTHQTTEPGNVLKKGSTSSYVIRNGSVIANLDSGLEDCNTGAASVVMTGHNVGNLLTDKHVTWGWFYGDFKAQPGSTPTKAVCLAEYDEHYDPFQYYPSTANPHHLPPTSIATIGHDGDRANHQYDLTSFWAAVDAGNMPSVSFVKAPANQTGHPMTSGALLEQTFLVNTINRLEQSPDWPNMAILIAYDDSDGWYDHVLSPIVNQSNDAVEDTICLNDTLDVTLPGGAFNDRCGYGQRLPFLVISPFAKPNYIDHAVVDTTSILRFIEDNWQLGRIDSLDNPGGAPTGEGSFDAVAGSIEGLLDFDQPSGSPGNPPLLLEESTGNPPRP
jgi:phospholipase C